MRLANSSSVIEVVSSFSSWSTTIDYFLTCRVSKSFNRVHVNRLRNIFLKYLDDVIVWDEIYKLISYGLIDFSDRFIYLKKSFLYNNFLSIFLFEIYLSEFDIYAENLRRQFISTKIIFLKFNKDRKDRIAQLIFPNIVSFPLKLDKSLSNCRILKDLFIYKKNKIRNFLLTNHLFLSFHRNFIFTRYKDHSMVVVASSKDFAYFLRNKLFLFMRSNLKMDFTNFQLFSKSDKLIFFLGYNVRYMFSKKAYDNFAYFLSFQKKFNVLLLSRLENFRKKLVSLSVKRLNSEFFFQSYIFLDKKEIFNSKYFKEKYWFYIFQLEAIRSFQFYKVIMSKDLNYLIPKNQIFKFGLQGNFPSSKFFFNSFLSRSNKLLEKIIISFFDPIKSSFFSFDLKINLYLLELKKKLIFYYYLFSLRDDISVFKFSSFKEKFILSQLNSSKVTVLFPLNYVYLRLRDLGFFHPRKYRPISNLKLIFLNDESIIKIYGYFAYSFLHWYSISNNFYQVKSLVEFLRESCILTLCRKHNKPKSWAFNVYSSSLFSFKGLFLSNANFPSKKYVYNFNYEFLYCPNFIFLDEKLFCNM